MPTRRTLLLLLVAGLACAIGVLRGMTIEDDRRQSAPCPARAGSGGVASAPRPVVASHENKPLGPVSVLLESVESTPRGQAVRATMRPVRILRSLAWRWETSEGVVLVAGASEGTADATVDSPFILNALVLPPSAGRSGRLTLVTEATFDGADANGPTGPEVAIQVTEMRWGDTDASSVPIVSGIDPATGETTSFAVVPSGHRPKR